MTDNLTNEELAPYGYPINASIMPAPKSYNALLRARAVHLRAMAIYLNDRPDICVLVKDTKARIKNLTKKINLHDKLEREYCERMGYEYQPRPHEIG